MLNLLLIDEDIKNVQLVVNKLGRHLHPKITLSKLCIEQTDVEDIEDFCVFDIIIVDEKIVKLKEIYRIISSVNKKQISAIIISDEQIDNNNTNIHIVSNMTEAILILYSLYFTNFSTNNKYIEQLLDNFEFNKSATGYTYIIDFLNICIEQNYNHISSLNEIYKKIAEKYNLSTYKNIGWNIEKAINNMKTLTNDSVLDKYFGFPPSPKLFLEIMLKTCNKNVVNI